MRARKDARCFLAFFVVSWLSLKVNSSVCRSCASCSLESGCRPVQKSARWALALVKPLSGTAHLVPRSFSGRWLQRLQT